jgi:hypothetical protein
MNVAALLTHREPLRRSRPPAAHVLTPLSGSGPEMPTKQVGDRVETGALTAPGRLGLAGALPGGY